MVEYTMKKQNLLVPLIGGLLFIFLGLLLVTGVIGVKEGAAEIDRIGGIVIGWCVIVFFCWIAVNAIIATLRHTDDPIIMIDEHGFYDRRVCIKPIPWSKIYSAHIFRGKSLYAVPLRFISLDVADPDEYQRKGIDRYFPRLFNILKKLYDEPGITIQTSLISQTPEEILSVIEKESKGTVLIKR